MEIKFHYVRKAINSKAAATKYCPTEVMLEDILARARFAHHAGFGSPMSLLVCALAERYGLRSVFIYIYIYIS